MHGSCVLACFCVSGVMCSRPARRKTGEREKERKRKKAIRNAQTVPDRPTVVPSVPLVYRVVLFVSNLHADFCSLTLHFCFRQLDNPSWFRHRVPWQHLFTRGVMRFPLSWQGWHASFVPDHQILLEGPWICHSLDVEPSKRSPVVISDSIMNSLKHHGRPIHASSNSSSPRRRYSPLGKRHVEANRKIQR